MNLRVLLRAALALALVAVAGYAAVAALLYKIQDNLVFPAPGGVDRAALDAAAAELGVDPLDLHARDGTRLYAWHRVSEGKRAILYFHGNGASLLSTAAYQRAAAQRGWDFLAVAYRGYPGSDGHPSEAGLNRDAHALWDYATNELGLPPEKLVIQGTSLGGGVAVGLAADVRPAGLVLESTFTSLVARAEQEYGWLPVRRLLKNPFDSIGRAPAIACPTLVVHSTADEVIPVSHGRALARAFPDATYVEVDGLGHNAAAILNTEAGREAWSALLGRVDPTAGTRAAPAPAQDPP